MEEILKETYGVIVYQEQVMKIASEIAGFSLAKADLMRRAMGKKDKELMAKQKAEFIDGAVKKGTSRKVAADIFDLIEKFASYGFNKSHSVAYSILAYQTAYLKAHYPAEYMAAAISAEIGDTEYVVQLIDDCRKMNLQVLPPDVNESDVQFVVTPRGIRFGMSAIKNVGVSAVENVIKVRAEKGRFENIFDFCSRVDLRLVNKKTLEGLIQAGAFDTIHENRSQLFESVEKAIQFGQNIKGYSQRGQSSLFESGGHNTKAEVSYPALNAVREWSETDKLQREKSVLGFYVSGHPLLRYDTEMRLFTSAKLGNPSAVKSGSLVRVGGIIASLKKKIDKKGNMMAFVTLEDFTGKGELIVFASAYKEYQSVLVEDAMVMVVGKAEQNGDALRILANEVIPMELVRNKFTKSITLAIRLESMQSDAVNRLRKLAEQHRGTCSCYFSVVSSSDRQPMVMQATNVGVKLSDEFIQEVEKILGPDSVVISN